jgi:hypothetical protein
MRFHGRPYLVHDILVIVELVRSHTWTCLHDRRHVVVPFLALLWLVPVDSPTKVTRIDVGSEPVNMPSAQQSEQIPGLFTCVRIREAGQGR